MEREQVLLFSAALVSVAYVNVHQCSLLKLQQSYNKIPPVSNSDRRLVL
jgi:hypothetical protein